MFLFLIVACDEGPGICAILLTICSVLLILVTLPFSLLVTVKVVQVRTGEKFGNIIHYASSTGV